jgi:hypothetical protein
MAIVVSEQLDDVISTTIRHIVPNVVDNFFTGRPLLVRLMSQNNVVLDGGAEIQHPFLYDAPPGGAFALGGELDITRKNIMSALRFPWATYYSAVTVEGLELLQNSGPEKIVDLVEMRMQAGRMKLEDSLGNDIFGNDTDGPGIVGLRVSCDNGDIVGAYGGITRATTGPGSAIKGNVNTSASVQLDTLTTGMGSATVGPARPDLIVTTQAVWNNIHDLLGGAGASGSGENFQRFPGGDGTGADIANAGFDVINWQRAQIVVDNQCPTNHLFMLNTKYIKIYVHSQRNFETDGPHIPPNRDQKIWRVLTACQLVNAAPRLNTMFTSLAS